MVLCLTMPILTKEKKERELPLTSESLKSADGLSGLMDKHKVEQTVWLIHEIKQIHSGVYRVNDDGQLDPSNGRIVKEFTFRGKKQTVKSLMDIEAQAKSLSEGERKELSDIFNTLKAYFDKVNIVLAPEAAGTHPLMRPPHRRPPGINQINFQIAPGTPDGCYLPLLVTWGAGAATSYLGKTSDGSPCQHPFGSQRLI